MVSKNDFWHILDINNISNINEKINNIFQQFEYQGKKTSVTHQVDDPLLKKFSFNNLPDLIIISITPESLENSKRLFNLLLGKFKNTPIIAIYDESYLDIYSLKNIELYNINGFINLKDFSSFNTIQLIKSSLKERQTFEKYEGRKKRLDSSNKQLLSLSRLMSETELLSLSGSWEWDISNKKLTWTDGIYKIHELPLNILISPEKAFDFYSPDDKEIIKNSFHETIINGGGYDLTLNIKSYLGNIKTVRTTGRVRKTKGKVSHVYGSITDVTRFASISKDIKNKNNFINGILNGIPDAIIVSDEKGYILEVNPASQQVLGFPRDELINKNVLKLIPEYQHKQLQSYINDFLKKTIYNIIGKHHNIDMLKASGKVIPVEIIINKVNQQGKQIYISLIKNIEKEVAIEKRVHNLAFIDRVTKLPNNRSFEDDYYQLMEQYKLKKAEVCFVQINIDQFFKINFAYGHSFGNQVLCYIAKLLKTLSSHYNGNIYRISGISFILMFKHKKNLGDLLEEIKNNVLKLLLKRHMIKDKTFDLTPIITVYSDNSVNIEKSGVEVLTLLELCKQGRNQEINLLLIDEPYLAIVNRKIQIENALKHAVNTGKGLYLLYQPQIDCKGNVCSAEALIRMYDEILGVIYPDEFIKIAERTGLIIPLTKWVIQKSLEDTKHLIAEGIEIPISVNISANHIVQTDFVDDILSQIDKVNTPPELLILELTESAFTDDIHTASMNMTSLSNKNIKFSLDDFGTGYSNLGYFNQLPFDELKIDKVFIDNIINNEKSQKLLELIISIGKLKGLKIVAEGVETIEQLNLLKKYDIDLFQGYYYSQPIKINDLKDMLFNYTYIRQYS